LVTAIEYFRSVITAAILELAISLLAISLLAVARLLLIAAGLLLATIMLLIAIELEDLGFDGESLPPQPLSKRAIQLKLNN